jgi:hypothetical protein
MLFVLTKYSPHSNQPALPQIPCRYSTVPFKTDQERVLNAVCQYVNELSFL